MKRAKFSSWEIPRSPLIVLNDISGIGFDEAWDSHITTEYGGQTINVIGREALIKNKKASDREQDKLDVNRLEEEAQRYE